MNKEELTTSVLINGAGTTGLMMACQLALQKIPFRIIEKKTKRETYSGAMIIHARSLEIFHQMGIALKLLKEGVIARRVSFQFNYKQPITVDIVNFGEEYSPFPYVLILEQWKTEKILTEFLAEHNYLVETGTMLLSFSQKKEIVTSVLKKPNGEGEIVTSRYLIGADGNSSLVRRQLKVPFYGKTHPELLFVSDCTANIDVTYAEMIFTFTPRQTLGYFPLPNSRWRIDGSISELNNLKEKISFNHISKYIEDDKNMDLRMEDPAWFSVFRSHARCVPVLSHNSCFLVGDAAHVYSPVGAQGMNTGLQDSYNLGWKMAFVLKGFAKKNILHTYHDERLPIIKKTLRYTDLVFGAIVDNRKKALFIRLNIVPVLLKLVLPLVMKSKFLRRKIFIAISGTGIQYRNSSLSGSFKALDFFDTSPRPGDRLPYIEYFIGTRVFNLHERIKPDRLHLFVLGLEKIPDSLQPILEQYHHFIDAEAIPVHSGTYLIFKKMVTFKYACYLIRPDLHIAWRSDYIDYAGLRKYFQLNFYSINDRKEGVDF